MAIAIVKKTFENYNKNAILIFANYILILDKFALKAFNQLFYHWKVSGLLIASFLLNLLDLYFLKAVVKTININLLKKKFL